MGSSSLRWAEIMAAAASVLAMSTALRGPRPWASFRSSAMVRSGGAPASWWTTVMYTDSEIATIGSEATTVTDVPVTS